MTFKLCFWGSRIKSGWGEWGWFLKNVENADVCSGCYEIKDFFQFLIFSSQAGVQELGVSIARPIAKLANGNMPYHRHHTQFTNGHWPGTGSYRLVSFLWVRLLSHPGVQLFQGFCDFGVLCSLLWDWLQISHQVMRKSVLYVVCFAYSLLSVVVVFHFFCLYLHL